MPTGLFVTHPLTARQVPVWVGNYVLMSYGDGAVMGVPAHDERDFAFAQEVRHPIRQVIAVEGGQGSTTDALGRTGMPTRRAACHQLRQIRRAGPDKAPSMPWRSAGRQARAWARRKPPGACATGASAASATGARPSPSSTAMTCGAVPVPEKDLPVVLPEGPDPDGSGNPLNKRAGLPERRGLPEVRQAGARETDTMDTFVDSVLVLHALLRPEERPDAMVGRRRATLLDADGPVHRRHRARHPAPAVRALLDQGDARPRPGHRRAVHAAC